MNCRVAYLAGFMDGDGCFFCNIQKRRAKSDVLIIKTGLEVSQKQSAQSQQFIKDLISLYGGRYSERKGKYSPIVVWRVEDSNTLLKLLPELIPFLKFKKEQAQLLLEIIQIKTRLKPFTIRSNEDMLKIASLNDTLGALKNKQPKKKWTAQRVQQFLAESYRYSEEGREDFYNKIRASSAGQSRGWRSFY